MELSFINWNIEKFSAVISIATPFILLIWFYYSQRQQLSKQYYKKINGIYAGFTDSISKREDKKGIQAGIIMHIRDQDDKGFFKGEFDFAETLNEVENGNIKFYTLRDGIHTFIGKLDFQLYREKTRHPLKPNENRIYKGILYIVDRLDFEFEDYKMDMYLSAEYDIIHYREMETMKFTIRKIHRKENHDLPNTFVLHKKIGATFEPYTSVKETVFLGNTRSDK